MKKLMIALVLAFLTACGGSSGSSDAEFRISSPEQDSVYRAGETISYELQTEDFNLAAPFNLRASLRHGGIDAADLLPESKPADTQHDAQTGHSPDVGDHGAGAHTQTAEESGHARDHANSDGHHSGNETNPAAKEGHYHIYLNDAVGSDAHITAWSRTGDYKLPANLGAGMHSLRFELRDNHHVRVEKEAILFFEVAE